MLGLLAKNCRGKRINKNNVTFRLQWKITKKVKNICPTVEVFVRVASKVWPRLSHFLLPWHKEGKPASEIKFIVIAQVRQSSPRTYFLGHAQLPDLTVFRIRNVWIGIRIRKVPLYNGSGFCCFRLWLSRTPSKKGLFSHFCAYYLPYAPLQWTSVCKDQENYMCSLHVWW
jgi:hypothetical protein